MTTLEAVRNYLRTFPGLESLSLDTLDYEHGGACLRPVPGEPVTRTYLDGATRRQEQFDLWIRRGSRGGDEARAADLRWLSDLAETLEQNTRRGILPDLGPGKQARSLRTATTAAPEILQENGLLVDQITLRLDYLMEG